MPQRRGDGGVRRKKEEGMRNDGAGPHIKRQRRDYNYVARCYMIMYGAAPGWAGMALAIAIPRIHSYTAVHFFDILT